MPCNQDIRIHSFDIFDTVLTRYVVRPQDIFMLMQTQICAPSIQVDFPARLVNEFKRNRVRAELMARCKAMVGGVQEISLVDIYEQLAKKFSLDQKQKDFLMDVELSTEASAMSGIKATAQIIKKAREEQKKIIFVSDMYLPKTWMEKILIKLDVYRPSEDVIYMSNEYRLTKASGGLFKFILKDQQCAPHQLCHLGDDWHSDVAVPFAMGIQVYGNVQGGLRPSRLRGIYNKCRRLVELINV